MKMFKKQLLALITVCLLAMAFSVVPASAAPTINYDVYFKLDGVTGESTTRGYENWIIPTSIDFEVSTPIASSGAPGKAFINQFKLKKVIDSSSPSLFTKTVSGERTLKGQIVFVKQGKGQEILLTIDLTDVIISDYIFNDLSETVSLKFDSIKLSYTVYDPKTGAKKNTIIGGWDFKLNKKL
ncbi:type VI secretion system tube protein Hcp [Paenibacillus sp. GP183]|uniref:Hcp family type VI secretion system effector n=1 Tax=Paenibacillus sp. GP183 TaxID=1882751 RepID=UPI0008956377|nr:type VI secretion system tube protein Hcp [Paenibacillus sp. GP183]SEB42492.1 Type VI protein secretion system component Hcp (secreted cytotoxin) [Paenibacillus sp. GP183]